MSQVTMPCTCCGLLLEFAPGAAVTTCPACGTRNACPSTTGETLLSLQRATEQRLACDFHAAEQSYQQVLQFHPDDHEALWGRLLCHYGVEYVEDPATKRRMPTVHNAQAKPLQSQPDYAKACKMAPADIRAQYEKDARYIDDAQADIRQAASTCPPYDVFLCHKTTKPGTKEKTEDFMRGTQLYHFLKDQGVRVFFAPECLQNIAGANYEAGIYHALHTSKVMLIICSNPDYITSPWVRSEWTRYMTIMEQEPEKQLIPLFYDHFDPSDLPHQFRFNSIQGMDMGDINASQRLLNVVSKLVPKEEKPAVAVEEKKPEPLKPEVPASPAPRKKTIDAKYSAALTFPKLRDHWDTVPKWKVYDSNKKKVLADVKWDATVDVPLKKERCTLWYGRPVPVRANVAAWLFLVLFALAAYFMYDAGKAGGLETKILYDGYNVILSSARELGMVMTLGRYVIISPDTCNACAIFSAFVAFLLLCSMTRKSICVGKMLVTTDKEYRLSWPKKPKNDQFLVEER